jgi:hypothetical protein
LKETAGHDVLAPQAAVLILRPVSENPRHLNAIGQHPLETDPLGHPISVLGTHLHSTQQVHLRPGRRDLLLFRLPRPSHGHGKADYSRVRRIDFEMTDFGTMKQLRLPDDDLYQKALHLLVLELFLRGSTNFRHGESGSGA